MSKKYPDYLDRYLNTINVFTIQGRIERMQTIEFPTIRERELAEQFLNSEECIQYIKAYEDFKVKRRIITDKFIELTKGYYNEQSK